MGTSEIIGLVSPISQNLGYRAPQQELVLMQYEQTQEKNQTLFYLGLIGAVVLAAIGLILFLK